MTICVITGGREHHPSPGELATMLDILIGHGITVVRTGGAIGVDTDVYEWLRMRGGPSRDCREWSPQHLELWVPDWLRYHRAAGAMRNIAMLTGHTGHECGIRLDKSIIYTAGQRASLCIAFTGDTGTMRCCEAARARDIPIQYITRRATA